MVSKVKKMDNETFRKVISSLPVKDYERRIFNLNRFIENGHLQ